MISTRETLHESLDNLIHVTGGKHDDPAIQRVIDAKYNEGFDLASMPTRDQLDAFIQAHGGTITGEAADTSYRISRDDFRLIVMGLRVKQDYNVMTVVDMAKVSLYMADYFKTLNNEVDAYVPHGLTDRDLANQELLNFFRFVCERMKIETGPDK